MRVITGTARGRKLITLEGEDVRPTTDRVKEAMFSIIQFELEGRRVLDMFAGSGQLGIEALSRGAESALFADADSRAVEIIKKNLASCGLKEKAVVVNSDSFAAITRGGFDIALLDPPYGKGILQRAVATVADKMNPGGVIICESPYGEELPEKAGRFSKFRTYKYGKTELTVYRESEEEGV